MEEITKYQFKSGLPYEFEILRISEMYKNHKEIMTQSHRAQFYQILIIEKGSAAHWVDFKKANMSAGSVLFIPTDSVNLFDSSLNYDGYIILFTPNFFCKSRRDTEYLTNTVLFNNFYELSQINSFTNDATLSVLLGLMQQEFASENNPLQYDILRNHLHSFLLYSERVLKSKDFFIEIMASENLSNLVNFREILEENYKEHKSVSKYADILNITEKKLNKATKLILGKTTKEYINDRILLEAKRLIVHTDDNVKEVSFELGFDEPTNFVKFFKRYTNDTPLEFKEKFLKL